MRSVRSEMFIEPKPVESTGAPLGAQLCERLRWRPYRGALPKLCGESLLGVFQLLLPVALIHHHAQTYLLRVGEKLIQTDYRHYIRC